MTMIELAFSGNEANDQKIGEWIMKRSVMSLWILLIAVVFIASCSRDDPYHITKDWRCQLLICK